MDKYQKTEVYEEMKKWNAIWLEESAKYYETGNKVAGKRARKAIDQVCKLRVAWKKSTIGEKK